VFDEQRFGVCHCPLRTQETRDPLIRLWDCVGPRRRSLSESGGSGVSQMRHYDPSPQE
jgi:hypothetical protein